MFLLDTNVVSELRKAKAGKADANVTAWALGVAPGIGTSCLHLSAASCPWTLPWRSAALVCMCPIPAPSGTP